MLFGELIAVFFFAEPNGRYKETEYKVLRYLTLIKRCTVDATL